MTVTGLQSLGSHLDVATRSREFLTAAAASWPSFSHACRRPLSPTPCLVFWLTTYRWHGSLLLLRTGTGAKPRHAEWHAFLSSHGALPCLLALLCFACVLARTLAWLEEILLFGTLRKGVLLRDTYVPHRRLPLDRCSWSFGPFRFSILNIGFLLVSLRVLIAVDSQGFSLDWLRILWPAGLYRSPH